MRYFKYIKFCCVIDVNEQSAYIHSILLGFELNVHIITICGRNSFTQFRQNDPEIHCINIDLRFFYATTHYLSIGNYTLYVNWMRMHAIWPTVGTFIHSKVTIYSKVLQSLSLKSLMSRILSGRSALFGAVVLIRNITYLLPHCDIVFFLCTRLFQPIYK